MVRRGGARRRAAAARNLLVLAQEPDFAYEPLVRLALNLRRIDDLQATLVSSRVTSNTDAMTPRPNGP